MSYSDWTPFDKETIDKAPIKAGVYFLGSEHETTYTPPTATAAGSC